MKKPKQLFPIRPCHKSTLQQFDKKYIDEVLPKHVAKTVMKLTSGVMVQDYDIERVRNINEDFEIHTVRITTLAGKHSTFVSVCRC